MSFYDSLSFGKKRVAARVVKQLLRERHGKTEAEIKAMDADGSFAAYVDRLHAEGHLVGGETETIRLAGTPDFGEPVADEEVEAVPLPVIAAPAVADQVVSKAVSGLFEKIKGALDARVAAVADQLLGPALAAALDGVDEACLAWCEAELQTLVGMGTAAVQAAMEAPDEGVFEIRVARLARLAVRYQEVLKAAGSFPEQARAIADRTFAGLARQAKEQYEARNQSAARPS